MSTSYVAYYRVSTQKQGVSGLGLDAQRLAVANFIRPVQLIAEFTEVESGKKSKNRPQLLAALAECRRTKAVLIIAKLDRLARSVHFISGLMESRVEFLAVDMPYANRLTVHILAAVAEHEAKMTSDRTKSALQAAKARGTVLGNPRLDEARAASVLVTRTYAAPEVVALMKEARAQGATLRFIAPKLNRLGLRTQRGSDWHGRTVLTELNRAA